MADRPEAHIVHLTPSRVRLKIPARRHDKGYFSAVSTQLREAMGAEIESNPATGSVLITAADALNAVRALGDKAPFDIVDRPQEPELSLPQLRRQVESANARFTRFFGGDARGYIVFALVATSLLQFARGRTLAPAVTLLWYASEGLRLWTPRPDRESR
ncbi:hypothetical protein [Methylocystis sp. S23]|jgi:hypothetical protein